MCVREDRKTISLKYAKIFRMHCAQGCGQAVIEDTRKVLLNMFTVLSVATLWYTLLLKQIGLVRWFGVQRQQQSSHNGKYRQICSSIWLCNKSRPVPRALRFVSFKRTNILIFSLCDCKADFVQFSQK